MTHMSSLKRTDGITHRVSDTVHPLCHYWGKLKTGSSVQPISSNRFSLTDTPHNCLSNRELWCETSSKLPQQHPKQEQRGQSTPPKDILHLPHTPRCCAASLAWLTGCLFIKKKLVGFLRSTVTKFILCLLEKLPSNSSTGKFWLPLKWTIQHFAPAGIGIIESSRATIHHTERKNSSAELFSGEHTIPCGHLFGVSKGNPRWSAELCSCLHLFRLTYQKVTDNNVGCWGTNKRHSARHF